MLASKGDGELEQIERESILSFDLPKRGGKRGTMNEISEWKARSLKYGDKPKESRKSKKNIYCTTKCNVDNIDDFLIHSKDMSVNDIRKVLKNSYDGISIPNIRKHLKKCLYTFGKVYSYPISNFDWQQAFRFSQKWNIYSNQEADLHMLKKWIVQGKVKVGSGIININLETWKWLVTQGYFHATKKESVNHHFLKWLLELHFRNEFPGAIIKNEKKETIFYEQIRYDLYAKWNDQVIVGELGGVQVWKVMTTLEKGHSIYVIPHWTTNKVNPFKTIKKEFQYFKFEKGG